MDAHNEGSHPLRWLPNTCLVPSLKLADPGIHFGFCLILGIAIVLLEATLELSAAAVNDVKIVICQLAPLGLSLAANFFPFSFDLIPIHNKPPLNGPHKQYAGASVGRLLLPNGDR